MACLLIIFSLASCAKKDNGVVAKENSSVASDPKSNLPTEAKFASSDRIIDDGVGNAYIGIAGIQNAYKGAISPKSQTPDSVIEITMKGVANWEKVNPNKRINTWSIVYYPQSHYHHIDGLLIHYEIVEPK